MGKGVGLNSPFNFNLNRGLSPIIPREVQSDPIIVLIN